MERNIGKKPHKFTYTYKDIARLTGLSINTVRQYASKGNKNKFNPYSFESVVFFLASWREQERIVQGILYKNKARGQAYKFNA